MEERGTSSSSLRFAVVPAQSVTMMAEAEGHPDLSSEVSSLLAEDVSYRLREVIQNACQYMKHSRRKRLTVEDVNKALKCADVQPVFGHGAPEGQPWRQAKEGELFLVEDLDMALPNIACNMQVPHATGSTTLRANWLVIEGNQKGATLSQNMQGKVNGKVGRGITEDLLQYHNSVTRAILGTDQELMKLALTDLRTNPNIAPLLPYLVDFLSNWIKNMNHNASSLTKLLYTIHALVKNKYLFLEPRPYLTVLTECVIHCLTESLNGSNGDHWAMREYAARLLAIICRQWDSPVNKLYDQVLTQLHEILHDTNQPFSAHYGILTTLCYFGIQALKDVLIPYFPTYWKHLMATMNDITLIKERIDAHKVYGALMNAAAVIIRYHKPESAKLKKPDSNPPLIRIKQEDRGKISSSDSTPSTTFSGLTLDLPEPCPKVLDIEQCYQQFWEYFGDSLLVYLPVQFQHQMFKRPFKKDPVISLSDADSHRTGEEMLQEFLTKATQPLYKRTVSMDVDPENRSEIRRSFDDMSFSAESKSERSSRSERSHSDDGFLGEDADLTIKSTVTDPMKGIKLFISKRPKKAGRGRPESKKKRLESARSKLNDAFDIQTLRRPKKEIYFGFNTKDWSTNVQKLTYSKPQRKRKSSHLVLAPKSEYRKLCTKLTPFGKLKSQKKTIITPSTLNIGCFM